MLSLLEWMEQQFFEDILGVTLSDRALVNRTLEAQFRPDGFGKLHLLGIATCRVSTTSIELISGISP